MITYQRGRSDLGKELSVPNNIDPSTLLRLAPKRSRGIKALAGSDATRDSSTGSPSYAKTKDRYVELSETKEYLKRYVEVGKSEPHASNSASMVITQLQYRFAHGRELLDGCQKRRRDYRKVFDGACGRGWCVNITPKKQ